MRLLQTFVFRGPSLHHSQPVIRLTLDPAGVDLTSESEAARRAAGLLAAGLPPDVSFPDASEGLSLAGCVCRLALILQQEFGYAVKHSAILPEASDGTVKLIYAYADPGLAAAASGPAVQLTRIAAGLGGESTAPVASGRIAEAFDRVLGQLRSIATAPPTRRTLWEADRRGIPWSRMRYSDNFMQLGQGHKRRRFRNSYWQETPYLSMHLATSKMAAAELLRSNGIPVPVHRLAQSEEEAVAAAAVLGYPVVVKPNGRDMGTAVSINLADEHAVRAAYAKARPHGPALIEKQVSGIDYRITVLHGRMIAAGREDAASVIGDGHSTIQDLIDDANRDPRRNRRDYYPMKPLQVDEGMQQFLAQQGHDLTSVPAAGKRVPLRRWWRDGNDGVTADETSRIHPANQAIAERASRLVGLDLAGVDYISPDISRPWYEVGGVINEINPTPGLNTHVRAGAPDVHRIIVEAFFPPGDDGRIPLGVLITAPEAPEVVSLVARLLDRLGHCTLAATAKGVRIGGEAISHEPRTGLAAADMAFADPLATAGVLELCDKTVETEGLSFDRATVVAVMQVPESLAAARLLLSCAAGFVVLNADSPGVAALADDVGECPVLWVSRGPLSAALKRHTSAGGCAVLLSEKPTGAEVHLWEAGRCHVISGLDELLSESDIADAATALFAVAMHYGLSKTVPDTFRSALARQGGPSLQ